MKGLILPFKYEYGHIADGTGKVILYAERNSLVTPLNPCDRDNILKLVTVLLNEAFEYDKADRILKYLND